MNVDKDKDYIDLEDESDEEGTESSDDGIDILLRGTQEQTSKMYKHKSTAKNDESSEDEFEKEMNAELNGKVKEIEKTRGLLSVSATSGHNKECDGPQRYYDDVYFDSDEEDMVTAGDANSIGKEMTNDELLYDPNIDEENEKWVENKRRAYLPKGVGESSIGKQKPLPHSDAVLNCPACMTTLCLDCQRHDVYQNQYRAMFVSNCSINTLELLKYPKPKAKSQKQKEQQNIDHTSKGEEEDKFHPVKCTECNTVVAVVDEDEIYHFFNVVASY